MQKLLMPAAEILAMDATDYCCGDMVLKDLGKDVRPEPASDISFTVVVPFRVAYCGVVKGYEYSTAKVDSETTFSAVGSQ